MPITIVELPEFIKKAEQNELAKLVKVLTSKYKRDET